VTATDRRNQQETQRRAAVRTALALAVFALGCYVTFVVIRL
jgi:hypothetical protein